MWARTHACVSLWSSERGEGREKERESVCVRVCVSVCISVCVRTRLCVCTRIWFVFSLLGNVCD